METRMSMPNWTALPEELWTNIFSRFFTLPERSKLELVCRVFYDIMPYHDLATLNIDKLLRLREVIESTAYVRVDMFFWFLYNKSLQKAVHIKGFVIHCMPFSPLLSFALFLSVSGRFIRTLSFSYNETLLQCASYGFLPNLRDFLYHRNGKYVPTDTNALRIPANLLENFDTLLPKLRNFRTESWLPIALTRTLKQLYVSRAPEGVNLNDLRCVSSLEELDVCTSEIICTGPPELTRLTYLSIRYCRMDFFLMVALGARNLARLQLSNVKLGVLNCRFYMPNLVFLNCPNSSGVLNFLGWLVAPKLRQFIWRTDDYDTQIDETLTLLSRCYTKLEIIDIYGALIVKDINTSSSGALTEVFQHCRCLRDVWCHDTGLPALAVAPPTLAEAHIKQVHSTVPNDRIGQLLSMVDLLNVRREKPLDIYYVWNKENIDMEQIARLSERGFLFQFDYNYEHRTAKRSGM